MSENDGAPKSVPSNTDVPQPEPRTRTVPPPWMNLLEAIAWIATAGAHTGLPDVHPGFRWPPTMADDGSYLPPAPPLVMHVAEAQRRLVAELAAGNLVAYGVLGPVGKVPAEGLPKSIPAIAWGAMPDDQAVRAVINNNVAIPYLRLSETECWWSPKIKAANVESRWPFVAGVGAVASCDAALSAKQAAAIEWMQTATALTAMKRENAIKECRNATGCTFREAIFAWMALPSDRRGTRGRPGLKDAN
ncbi:hypothetical protein [Falsiroseomonas sp. E2-1-a20]|uniref:hypothetical protein n=1 Tax=Falsiroseomonas sp. E2-1-a20 TaxID=3239300 RepID=UPI003F2D7725